MVVELNTILTEMEITSDVQDQIINHLKSLGCTLKDHLKYIRESDLENYLNPFQRRILVQSIMEKVVNSELSSLFCHISVVLLHLTILNLDASEPK